MYIRLVSKTTVVNPLLVKRQITNENQLENKNRQCSYIRDL